MDFSKERDRERDRKERRKLLSIESVEAGRYFVRCENIDKDSNFLKSRFNNNESFVSKLWLRIEL